MRTSQIARFSDTRKTGGRNGYSLIELIIGMASSTLLISGMASTLYISSQALNLDERPARQSSIASEVLGDMMADLRHASKFTERTATAVTFAVPDRDGDGFEETIRYAWSGTLGDPLTYQYNGGDVEPIAQDVQAFNLTSMTRFLPAADVTIPTAVPTYVDFSETKVSTNLTSINLAVPAGTSEGDLLIAIVVTDGNNTASLLAALGWNTLDIGDQAGKVTLGVWWKNAGANEPANHTFTWANNEQAYGWLMRFTGHDPANPIHVFATTSGSSTTPTSPAVISSVDNTLIVRIGGFDRDDVTVDDVGFSGHTTMTMDFSKPSSASASGGAAYVEQTTAGNTGTTLFTLGSSQNYRTLTLSIAPVPSP